MILDNGGKSFPPLVRLPLSGGGGQGGADLNSGDYKINALDNGLGVLLLLMERDSVTVTEVAAHLDLARSTSHRILSTFEQRGFVSLAASRHGYTVGPALADIWGPRNLDPEARLGIRPILKLAAQRTNVTVHSVVLLGSQVLLIDAVESEQSDRRSFRAGMVRPAHASAAGKLLLSRLAEGQLLAFFPQEELMRLNPRTIGTRTELFEELRVIREVDYAFSLRESEDNFDAVAVIASGSNWRDRVAIMAVVPTERSGEAELMRIARELSTAAKEPEGVTRSATSL